MFDEALVKDLTGDDVIRCRRMREDFWEYVPTHKLMMYGNHKPLIRGDDEGIWRRMRLIPWLITIPENERDTQLLEKLRAEWPGILAWAVRGCIAWQTQGLREPAAVRGATKAYREESDALGEFLRLRVTFDAAATIGRRELREAYESHAKESGAEPVGAKRFAGRLRELGCPRQPCVAGLASSMGGAGSGSPPMQSGQPHPRGGRPKSLSIGT